MADDAVLSAERAHLDLARECLIAMRASAERIADYGVDELSAFALGRIRADRLAALDAEPDAPPFFGRTDRDPEDDRPAPETLHIGRRHVRDDVGDPVVIDWRAPIARGFYRATPTDRLGVQLRRRFGFRDGELNAYEDEHLDRGEELGLASDLLRAEIERPRVGPMRDIVATIQPDQDEFVRADLDTSLCIQGAPGTGKTAVGLHRAAYLLYTYPDRLRRSGVLVVGPNDAFLDYIGQVLPSLGEVGITQSTVGELLAHEPRGSEPVEVAVLKGDARMADVARRALLSHVAKPAEDVVAVVGTKRYRVGAHHLRRYVDDARRALDTGLRWSTARERLRNQVAEDVRRQREDAGGAPSDAETAKVARSPAVRDWVDAVWPPLSAPALLTRLYAEPEFLQRCSRTTLTDDERALLARAAPRSARATKWTPADVVLLDELGSLIDGADTFVHAVVDEAQDLSAMQCRVVARRCPLGSVTVLGDLAQATTPWAPGSWQVTLDHLGHDAQVRPLTAGFRVPGEVLALANRLLPHIAPEVPPATSVRSGDDALGFAGRALLAEQVRTCLEQVPGSLAVIAADADIERVTAELGDTDARVGVVAASQAKGLEFDTVIVVEPAAIVAAETRRVDGLRRLYVVLTRAVSRLRIVHDDPLPAELQ
ncbi:HelD family protein [uncultured Jatrophihabitans sp.]|uniref:HelD family protein n=1 Tax=uncultured Jatrophihabitans sp. TaxID=1610747 RepID=UPI0035CA45FB